MNRDVAHRPKGEIALFDPEKSHEVQARADAVIEYAKRVKDWPTLERAVDQKIKDQTAFVAWWGKNVSTKQGPGRGKKTRADPRSFSMAKAEAKTQITHQQVSKWKRRLKEPARYRELLFGAAYETAMAEVGKVRGTQGTGENEWHTPDKYLELARSVLGAFDLDPASSDAAQKTVRADWYFTSADDGLKQEWHGRVWLNPPYAQPAIAHFADKMVVEIESKRVVSAIMLTHNYTDTAWFQKLARAAQAICFTAGRIRFVDPDGELAAPTQGQAFFYFGDDVARFATAFAETGFVVEVRR